MRTLLRLALALALAVALVLALVAQRPAQAAAAAADERVSHGRFKDVLLLRPTGPVRQFVLFLSGQDGWTPAVDAQARALVARGALVAGIDTARLFATIEAEPLPCTFPDGDFENLAHHLQAQAQVPTYLTPLLAGVGSGASFAYALLAQTAPTTFAGGLAIGFCPGLPLRKPLCKGEGQHFQRLPAGDGLVLLPAAKLPVPWWAVPPPAGSATACPADAGRVFSAGITNAHWLAAAPAAAYTRLATPRNSTVPPPPASLADLPIVEVPSEGNDPRLVVLLSGDGGWAGIDKGLAAAFASRGLAVAGFDSLRYFWAARTPAGLAADLDRVIRYYSQRWARREVVLVGYSQGADVLPFAINRLPEHSRALVAYTVLLGPGQKASFEFHVSNWLGPSGELPIAPEAQQLDAGVMLCVYGSDEKASLCPALAPDHAQPLPMSGGHHFGGDYDKLAALILDRLPR